MKKIFTAILLLIPPALSYAQVAKHNGGVSSGSSSAGFVLKSGDIMSGPLAVSSLSVTGAMSVNGIYNTGTSTSTFFYGDGSHLTGISSGTLSGMTTNKLQKATAANAIGDSSIIDNGTTVATTENITATTGTFTGNSFSVGGSTLVVSAGKVGINSAVPTANSSATLEVLGISQPLNLQHANGYTELGNSFIGSNDAVGIDLGGSLGLGGIYYSVGPRTTMFARLSGRKFDSSDGGQKGYFAIEVSQDAAPYITEKMRVLHNGNVGVNTATPTQKLEVDGSVVISSGTLNILGTGANLKIVNSPTDGTIVCFTAAGQFGKCTANVALSTCTCAALN